MARALGLTGTAVLLLGVLIVWAVSGLGGTMPESDGVVRDGARQIAIHGHTWGFSPRIVRVRPGETVQFAVRSEDLQHGFAINELHVNLALRPGQDVRSPAVRVDLPEGVYSIQCSVFCGIGHASMKARLVVGAPPPSASAWLPWAASLLSVGAATGFAIVARARRRPATSGLPPAPGRGDPGVDLLELAPVRRLVRLPAFQFLLVLPAAAAVGVVLLSAAVGIEHPSFNFGAVFTWVVWWGALLVSLLLLGRGWCLVCPIGAAGEWVQRLSFWWRTPYTAGYQRRWPGPLRNLGLATALFAIFVWLDNGYGVSNSPRMTAGLIAVLALSAAWVNLFFERRAFCRYVCPLTALIGLGALFAMLGVRRRDAATCRRCETKDCFRGNARRYGCPMGEFPGGAMDSNLSCILCAECVRSCPHDNVRLRLGPPGRDLWAMRRPRADGAVAAAVIVGLTTVLPLLLLTLLPGLRRALAAVLPAGAPPNDPPRLVAVALLFVLGVGAGVALIGGFSRLARTGAGPRETTTTRALFVRVACALVPMALFKMLAELLDHALRTWGTLVDVTRALALDFPLNRAVPGRVTVLHLLGPAGIYALQVALVLGGFLFSLYALWRLSERELADPEATFGAFVPMAGLGLVLTLISLWTLGAGLL